MGGSERLQAPHSHREAVGSSRGQCLEVRDVRISDSRSKRNSYIDNHQLRTVPQLGISDKQGRKHATVMAQVCSVLKMDSRMETHEKTREVADTTNYRRKRFISEQCERKCNPEYSQSQ